jgi:hypothetical protein
MHYLMDFLNSILLLHYIIPCFFFDRSDISLDSMFTFIKSIFYKDNSKYYFQNRTCLNLISTFFQATRARELLNASIGSTVSTISTSSSLTSHSSYSSSSRDLNLELNDSSISQSTIDENLPSCSQQSSTTEHSTSSQESILNQEFC